MPPSITLDSNNNIITLSADDKTIIITSGEITTTTEIPTHLENLIHAMLCVVADAVTVATCMLVFAVVFGGKPLDEIKESIRKGKANATRN